MMILTHPIFVVKSPGLQFTGKIQRTGQIWKTRTQRLLRSRAWRDSIWSTALAQISTRKTLKLLSGLDDHVIINNTIYYKRISKLYFWFIKIQLHYNNCICIASVFSSWLDWWIWSDRWIWYTRSQQQS